MQKRDGICYSPEECVGEYRLDIFKKHMNMGTDLIFEDFRISWSTLYYFFKIYERVDDEKKNSMKSGNLKEILLHMYFY